LLRFARNDIEEESAGRKRCNVELLTSRLAVRHPWPVSRWRPCIKPPPQTPNCPTMRKINIGVLASRRPNVVHTAPYVAKELGYFAKRCIDANVVQFEGGQSATSVARGGARVGARERRRRRDRARLRVKQIWGLRRACRRPTWWRRTIKTRPSSRAASSAHRRRRGRLQLAHGPRRCCNNSG